MATADGAALSPAVQPAGRWAALAVEFDAVPGTVSVWWAPLGTAAPRYQREPHATHYAASTMKIAVLAALHRAAEAGRLDLDAPVPVANDFASALPGAPRFRCAEDYDNDPEVWQRLGGTATLRWLAERMIVRSSNFATNLVLAHVGVSAVAEVWALAGAHGSMVNRGIEDYAARDAGLDNLVTAHDLAALLSAIALGASGTLDTAVPAPPAASAPPAACAPPAAYAPPGAVPTPPGPAPAPADPASTLASPAACRAMLDTLLAQERGEDLAAGLPPGTRIAHKNGWITGVRHAAGVVFPDDAPPYTIVVCTTTELAATEGADDAMCRLIARVAAATWVNRHGTA